MTPETNIIETIVGLWTENDYKPEDLWLGLCTAYRQIRRVRYEKVQNGVNAECNGLIRSLEAMP